MQRGTKFFGFLCTQAWSEKISIQMIILIAAWSLVGSAGFNGDRKPDYLLYNPSTRPTPIWYLNNNVYISHDSGPRLELDRALSGSELTCEKFS